MAKYNESEAQLFWFLQHKHEFNVGKIEMSLRPQGDNTTIQEDAVNLCEVRIENKVYLFGGIREGIYNNFAALYDHREKYECEHSFIDADNEAPYGHSVCRYCGETESR